MTILTDTVYLDTANFASGLIKDEDCTDITDWTTDGDTGSGVSSQAFFDGKSCFKFDTVAAGGTHLASRALDIGTYQTNPNIVSIKLYHDNIGTNAAADYFELILQATTYRCSIRFASDGLFIYDGSTWNEVGTNLVAQDTWQEWTFSWTQQVAGVVNVYLDGVLQASSVDCSDSTAGTTGITTMRQYGTSLIGLTYVDWFKAGNATRYAGETWLIQEGGQLTIRTDTRWHKNSPASMTGTLSTQTVTEGKLIYDGTDVRWLAITSGSGTPNIGDTISQGGVSGYYLGFWSSLTAAPSATIGATGFIKFREVTGGAFAAGALTFSGAGAATAAGADVAGWIEIVVDNAVTITVPRLGEHEIRGDWFYLADTDETVGQVIQLPTNGGGAATYCPGIWIETAQGSGEYEYWPSLYGSTNGWATAHIGNAFGENDARTNFVKDIGSGQVQIGQAVSLTGTYAHVASEGTTYVGVAHTCTYAVVGNVCTVTYPTGHLLVTGQSVGIDFSDGGASALDNTFTVTVLDAFRYSFALTTADTTGNCTARPGIACTFTAHAKGVGDMVYLNVTSGSVTSGNYEVYAVTSANVYLVKYPATSAVTSGGCGTFFRYQISITGHGVRTGQMVYLDFSSGAGVDGLYYCHYVPSADAFQVIANNGAAGDSGNVTLKMTIGNIPPDGCKTRIPNVILREAATGTRASNRVDAALASRPEWLTTSAGAIDFEYAYSTWYHNFGQAYAVKHHNVAYYDSMIISECATALDLDNCGASMFGALDSITLSLTSNFAGGTIQNSKFQRGNTPGSSDHAIALSYCLDLIFENVLGGIIQYARSTGYPFSASYGANITLNNFKAINGSVAFIAVNGATVNDLDYTDSYVGPGIAYSALYAVNIAAGSVDIMVDGVTTGFGGTIPNVSPPQAIMYAAAATNVTLRNVGTFDSPFPCGTFRKNLFGMGYVFATGGNNYNLRLQRIYIDDNAKGGLLTTINSDKKVQIDSVQGGRYVYSAMAVFGFADNGLNSVVRGMRTGNYSATGASSVYGSHFTDIFIGDTMGRYVLPMNEPTAETEDYFTMVSGTRKFNSVGGILMGAVGDQAVWEDAYFRKGHTGFQNTTPTMSGGTIGNYTIEYDIDTGTGFSDSWTTASGANLSAETIDPATGFRLKVRITTTTANLTAITFLKFDTISTAAAQEDNLYVLDPTYAQTLITVKDLSTGAAIQNARVLVYVTDGANFPYQDTVTITGSGTTATVSHTGHGMDTGDKVIIVGANQDEYNGVYPITRTGDNSYTYTTSSSVSASPATGTIKATLALIHGLTDVNGQISDERIISVDQPVGGWIRKADSSPYYIQGAISGTVDNEDGLSATVQLVRDE